MRKSRSLVAAVVAALAVGTGVTLSSTAVGASSTPTHVQFAAAGDFGILPASTGPVLEGMAAATPDFDLGLGDLSYSATASEQDWCNFVTDRVGAGFPFELLAGNHESNGENGNINNFSACLPNQLPGVVGTYGRQYYVDVPQDDPLMRFVMISPGLTFPDGTWNYTAGSARYNWTADAIDGARTKNIPWVVVGMHKPCLSLSTFGCDPGADLTQMLLKKKVDLVLSGHVHSYQRTKQLGLSSGCPSLAIGSYDARCVVDGGSDLAAGAGTVFAAIGTGGTGQMAIPDNDAEAGYFASVGGGSANPTFGFSDFDVTPDRLSARFVRTGGASFSDAFTLTKGATPTPPVNQSPVAAFTSASSGLGASFDARSSYDPDGAIAAYGWEFGDGTRGTGATASHSYAQAGSYTVTLTVTDGNGATDTLSRSVTVAAPVDQDVLAADNFERNLTNAWGTADAGGSWVVDTRTGVSSVNGKGVITLKSAGSSPSSRLTDVSSASTDMTMEFAIDALAKGTNAWVYESQLMRRIDGNNYYRGMIRINGTGGVRASIHRMVSGSGAMLTGEPFVPDLTYSPGDVLMMRSQATGTSPTTLRLKVWKKGTPEPSAWLLSTTDSSANIQKPGTVGLITYLTASATNAPIQTTVDNLRAVAP